jgi:hypothetical protein
MLLLEAGAVPLILQQLGMAYGLVPGTLSLALLACLAQVQGVAEGVLNSLVAPEPLHGLVLALFYKKYPTPRVEQELHGLVNRLGSSSGHVLKVLRVLLEEHLIGKFLQVLPQQLARLFLCQLLSTRGQEVMLDLEAEVVLDVPLALAQVITLSGVHMALPSAPAANAVQLVEEQPEGEVEGLGQQQQQQEEEEGQAPEIEPAAADQQEEYCTDMLACRLLLQHERLRELIAVYGEELVAALKAWERDGSIPQAVEATAAETDGSEVVAAVDSLIAYVVERDVQLQEAKQVCGASFDVSSSSDAASSMASSASSLEAALQQPDSEGVYISVVQGLVQPQQLPPESAGANRRPAVCEIEPEIESDSVAGRGTVDLMAGGPSRSGSSSSSCGMCNGGGSCSVDSGRRCGSGSSSGGGSVKVNGVELQHLLIRSSGTGSIVFKFEGYQHRVTGRQFKKLKQSSKLLKFLLGKAMEASGAQKPITELSIPQFTAHANWWVLKCLTQWCDDNKLPPGLEPQQVARLWIAAEVLQVSKGGIRQGRVWRRYTVAGQLGLAEMVCRV